VKVETGVDTDRDGTLDDNEVTSDALICNGIATSCTVGGLGGAATLTCPDGTSVDIQPTAASSCNAAGPTLLGLLALFLLRRRVRR
jgi:MYXO-CTERM domain-containing protein